MYAVGGYPHNMPSRTEIRKMYAETEAEKATADKVESHTKARQVVDDVNSVAFSLLRLDESDVDTAEGKGEVQFEAVPKKLGGFKKFFGIGETPVESIAHRASDKNDVASITGQSSGANLDVVVSFEDGREPLVYNKTEADNGEVYFQRGNDLVGLDQNGNLFFEEGATKEA